MKENVFSRKCFLEKKCLLFIFLCVISSFVYKFKGNIMCGGSGENGENGVWVCWEGGMEKISMVCYFRNLFSLLRLRKSFSSYLKDLFT